MGGHCSRKRSYFTSSNRMSGSYHRALKRCRTRPPGEQTYQVSWVCIRPEQEAGRGVREELQTVFPDAPDTQVGLNSDSSGTLLSHIYTLGRMTPSKLSVLAHQQVLMEPHTDTHKVLSVSLISGLRTSLTKTDLARMGDETPPCQDFLSPSLLPPSLKTFIF